MPDKAPNSYKDPSWDAIEHPLEDKYHLPRGGLAAIRTRGEKSNSDQVSPVGAATVYQIMPKTGATVRARTGVNAFSGRPQDAAEASAIVLSEGMRRTGSWGGSVTQYIGGTDPAKHGKVTRAYVSRVTGEDPQGSFSGDDSDTYQPPAPLTVDTILNTRPMDLKNAGRELPRAQPNPELSSEQSNARMIDRVTGGGLLTPGTPAPNQSGIADIMHEEAAGIRKQGKLDSYTFMDRQEAFWRNSILGKIVHSMDEGYTPPAEKEWHDQYVNNRAKWEALATNDEEVDWMRSATSQENLMQIMHRIGADRKSKEIANSAGSGWGLAGQIATDLVDPVGLAAAAITGGTTKAFGIGSAALKAAGRTGAAVGSFMAENATVNIGLTGVLQATGEHETSSDYLMAGLSGAAIGLGLAPLHLRGIKPSGTIDTPLADAPHHVDTPGLTRKLQDLEEAAAAEKGAYNDAARASLGDGATDEAVLKESSRMQAAETHKLVTGLMDAVPDRERLLAEEAPEGALPGETGFITRDAALKERVVKDYSLDTAMSDDTERNLAAETIARAERIDAEAPVGTRGTSTVLQKAGMESTGMRMRNSKSVVLRAFAALATESATGAGLRRHSAAMALAVRERLYSAKIMRYEDAFHLFREEQGVGPIRAFYDGQVRKRFDNRVAAEIEAREGTPEGVTFDQSHSVNEAADMMERGYKLMADDQRNAGTIGASRLRDNSRGYFPRQASARKIAALTPAQRDKVVRVLSRQFAANEEFSAEFSVKLAKKILERATDKVYGSYDVPMNLHSTEGADIVRDVLTESGLVGEALDKAIGKFSRGGAQHTKARLNIDLDESIGDGMKLRDLYNTDMVSLYRGQARRVAGEASLARYGIMGKHGLKQLRRQAQVTGADAHDLEAFDQVAAELINTPFGSHNHLYMDNLRIATSLSRLGGMGITQLAEYGNGVAAVGVHGTLAAIGDFRRLAQEVGLASKGKTIDNPLLHSLDEMGGTLGLDDYQQARIFNTPDNDIAMYGAESIGIGTRTLRGAAHMQAKLSAWRMITAVQTRGFSEQMLKRTMRFVKSGGEDQALRDAGISPELQARLQANMDKVATFDSGGKLKTFDIQAGDLTHLEMNNLRSAIERSASQIIQRTYVGETGKWAHDGFLKILLQFRTFSITSVEKQWGRNVKNYGALKAGMYLLGAMSLAAPIHYARVYAKMAGMSQADRDKYAKEHLSAYAVGRATMNYASASGLLGDIMDTGTGAYSSITGDDAGLADFTGAGGKGGGGSKLIGGVVAPSVGLVNDVASGVSNLSDASGRKKLYRAIPGANLPFVIPLLNLATPPTEAASSKF